MQQQMLKNQQELQQLYVNKLEDLNETDEFLDTHNLSKLSYDDMENINVPIIRCSLNQ